jgi:hypothetical protein
VYYQSDGTAGTIEWVKESGSNTTTLWKRKPSFPAALTSSRVPFASGTSTLSEDADFTFDTATNTIALTGGYKERSRSVAMGEWAAVAFSAGNYTASGGGSWTVAAGDQVSLRYTLVGKTATIDFTLNTTTVAGTPSTLILTIPGLTAAATALKPCARVLDNGGTAVVGLCETTASSAGIKFYTSMTAAGAWANSTDNTYVQGSITFEVQ